MCERSGAATWWAAGVVVVMVAVAGCSSDSTDEFPPAEASEMAGSVESEGLDATAEPSVSGLEGSGQLATSFDDSESSSAVDDLTVLGGVDVVPGLYRSTGDIQADPGNNGALFDTTCKWGLYAGEERGLDNLVMARNADGGHPMMRIAEGQRAYTQWCGRWELVDGEDPSAEFPETLEDGYWVAGLDVAPGIYEGATVPDPEDMDTWCVWTVWSSFEVGAESVASDFVMEATAASVTLETGQVLSSEMCGPWVRAE